MSLSYLNNCVNWPDRDVHAEGGLVDMIDSAIEVTRRTFLKHADSGSVRDLEGVLGYERFWRRGLTMASDYTVRYHRSKPHGKRVYFVTHSAIEYVFA